MSFDALTPNAEPSGLSNGYTTAARENFEWLRRHRLSIASGFGLPTSCYDSSPDSCFCWAFAFAQCAARLIGASAVLRTEVWLTHGSIRDLHEYAWVDVSDVYTFDPATCGIYPHAEFHAIVGAVAKFRYSARVAAVLARAFGHQHLWHRDLGLAPLGRQTRYVTPECVDTMLGARGQDAVVSRPGHPGNVLTLERPWMRSVVGEIVSRLESLHLRRQNHRYLGTYRIIR